ncbi:MAG: aminoacyl-tRNA deacylase [Pirellulales bacterium]
MNTREYLHQHKVPFELVAHAETYDAPHLAQAVHTPGREVAKAVLLRVDRGYRYAVALLPSTHRIDLGALSKALGGAEVELATEVEIAEHCPDCEFGVLPPFGSRFGAETIIDAALAADEQIVFEGDSHTEAIRIKYHDFYDLEHPRVEYFAARG